MDLTGSADGDGGDGDGETGAAAAPALPPPSESVTDETYSHAGIPITPIAPRTVSRAKNSSTDSSSSAANAASASTKLRFGEDDEAPASTAAAVSAVSSAAPAVSVSVSVSIPAAVAVGAQGQGASASPQSPRRRLGPREGDDPIITTTGASPLTSPSALATAAAAAASLAGGLTGAGVGLASASASAVPTPIRKAAAEGLEAALHNASSTASSGSSGRVSFSALPRPCQGTREPCAADARPATAGILRREPRGPRTDGRHLRFSYAHWAAFPVFPDWGKCPHDPTGFALGLSPVAESAGVMTVTARENAKPAMDSCDIEMRTFISNFRNFRAKQCLSVCF